MKGRTMVGLGLVLAVVASAVPAAANVFHMDPSYTSLEFVKVDNTDNLPDSRYGQGCGAVSYEYSMGKFEVTNVQYVEFLNAVAKSDTHELYQTNMWTTTYGCKINRTGADGNYSYSIDPSRADRPVNYVDYWDACRFVNWLTNGQPTGSQDANTTEDGTYFLNGYTGTDGRTIQRKMVGRYVLPTEDEWYKAAYHKNNGTTGDYWDYATQGNIAPTLELPPGHPEPNGSANCYLATNNFVDATYYMTEVGAYTQSPSPYDTFDQTGNVWEWCQAVVSTGEDWATRMYRGGSFGNYVSDAKANVTADDYPTNIDEILGFRVAEIPEPATLSLLALGGLAVLRRRKK